MCWAVGAHAPMSCASEKRLQLLNIGMPGISVPGSCIMTLFSLAQGHCPSSFCGVFTMPMRGQRTNQRDMKGSAVSY